MKRYSKSVIATVGSDQRPACRQAGSEAPPGRGFVAKSAPRNDTCYFVFVFLFLFAANSAWTDDSVSPESAPAVQEQDPMAMREEEALFLFDDQELLDGYTQKYRDAAWDEIIQMLGDESLSAYQLAATIRVFRQEFVKETVAMDKKSMERLLLQLLNRSPSPFVQVEAMDTLIAMDRYKYFRAMIPSMIQKLDHYNDTVNALAFDYLNQMIAQEPARSREAQIVFNSINKILFLSRNHLTNVKEPGPRLSQKIKLLRWSIKVLGTEDLNKLPKEVIGLL
ncbi:MAG: hypothetical protein COW13_00970 [Candidatus Omnitrophica bacterium CG12_big_fil_rev_8_21_14_0_65_50_5]|nr:MAG: hypothetical protein COW13_00970 [Candidatus Omnitrophica bacterium CG12_big_fil_rev_8_21_14_0_65_50_5]